MGEGIQRTAFFVITFLGVALPSGRAYSAFSNYNDVLIGEQAAGMGGAYTALVSDPAAGSFYNPAVLSRMKGTSLSAASTLYQKYDTQIGASDDLSDSVEDVNQGRFISVPASAGWVMAFGPFAAGMSIVIPDYESFTGQIQKDSSTETSLSIQDESLWVGGSLALNLTTHQSIGTTFYYTSRYFQRILFDQTVSGGETQLFEEKKTFTTNSLVYILGYYNQLSDYFSMGLSYRFPSLLISGDGQYLRSTLDTSANNEAEVTSRESLEAETQIPDKATLGLAYSVPAKATYTLDISYYAPLSYEDMTFGPASDRIRHKATWNVSFGAELQVSSIVKWRLGVFTNNSSHPDIDSTDERTQGAIDKWGFSTNMAIFTSDKISFTFGGYYTGGEGSEVERTGQRFQELDKSEQLFTMLIASSYYF